MKCDCMKRVEEKIKTMFEQTDTEHDGEVTACMDGKALLFEGGLRLSIPVTVDYYKRKKDGSLQVKHKKQSVLCTYCPFCGKKVSDD